MTMQHQIPAEKVMVTEAQARILPDSFLRRIALRLKTQSGAVYGDGEIATAKRELARRKKHWDGPDCWCVPIMIHSDHSMTKQHLQGRE
jgi:hypothetical protein